MNDANTTTHPYPPSGGGGISWYSHNDPPSSSGDASSLAPSVAVNFACSSTEYSLSVCKKCKYFHQFNDNV